MNKDPYNELGVSSKKTGVHEAIKDLSKGLYPGAFCKIVPLIGNLPEELKSTHAQIIHSDGVGTKSNIAYIARKEGYSSEIYHSLAQDAIVMNTDDMACVGAVNNIYVSNHIARNAKRITDEDLASIIKGYIDFYKYAESLGIKIYDAGGETADVGSYTTTLGMDVTATSIVEKSKIIDCSNIAPESYIVGLGSYGQSTYEEKSNSGIRSNGFTLAINALLEPYYRKYPETMDQTISKTLLYRGKYKLDDILPGTKDIEKMTILEALLSPTRTFLPVIKECLENNINIEGIIHCSGGGLTKSINFGKNIRYVKDDLLPTPPIFKAIQESGNITDEYMYQTFNMGHGIEIIVPTQQDIFNIFKIALKYHIPVQVIGFTEYAPQNEVVIKNKGKTLVYKK